MIIQEVVETIELLLSNRLLLYSLFHAVFGREPDAALLKILSSHEVTESFKLLSEEKGDVMEQAADFLSQWTENAPDEELLSQLRSEYTRLFIGPDKLAAPPWESVYRSKQGLLFQESTLTVREIYRNQGLRPEEYPHVPDDSLALELDFMTHMARRSLAVLRNTAADSWDGTDPALQVNTDLADLLTIQEAFLREHLLFFVSKLPEKISVSSSGLFYPQMLSILLDFLKKDREFLLELMSVGELSKTI